MQAYSNIQSLTIEEARRVLTEIANLSTSLDRLVFESTSAVINDRCNSDSVGGVKKHRGLKCRAARPYTLRLRAGIRHARVYRRGR